MKRIANLLLISELRGYQYAPAFIKKVVKEILKKTRRAKSKLFQGRVTKESLKGDFARIGIKEGDTIMFHSSLSRLGEVDGGAETLIEALLETVGRGGTVVVPTFHGLSLTAGDYTNDLEPCFDARHTPSRVGKVTEMFRHRKDALRSCHPTHSVAAIGQNASYIVKDHYRCDTPFSDGSPFERIMELGGKWLFLAVDIDKFTIFHVFEDHCPEFPYKVYYDHPLIVKTIDMYGEEKVVRTKIHDYDLSLIRIDNDKSKVVLNRVRKRFDEMHVLGKGRVGNGISYTIDARQGMGALGAMLKMGETIYLSEKEQETLKIRRGQR